MDGGVDSVGNDFFDTATRTTDDAVYCMGERDLGRTRHNFHGRSDGRELDWINFDADCGHGIGKSGIGMPVA